VLPAETCSPRLPSGLEHGPPHLGAKKFRDKNADATRRRWPWPLALPKLCNRGRPTSVTRVSTAANFDEAGSPPPPHGRWYKRVLMGTTQLVDAAWLAGSCAHVVWRPPPTGLQQRQKTQKNRRRNKGNSSIQERKRSSKRNVWSRRACRAGAFCFPRASEPLCTQRYSRAPRFLPQTEKKTLMLL